MIELTDLQYKDLQEGLKWEVAEKLPDGRVLGSRDKLGWTFEELDHKIAFLASRVPLHDKVILELGSYESILTVQLAKLSKFAVGLEVRSSNILCALTRLFVHDIKNAKLVMEDCQLLDDRFGTFDIVFHAGLLYHMLDPVAHMVGIAKIADTLLLATHYCTDDLNYKRDDITYDGTTYKAAFFKEGGLDERLSGMTEYSRWLYKDDLINLLKNLGYDQIEIDRDERLASGPKIVLLARRSKPVVGAANYLSKTNSEVPSSGRSEEVDRALQAAENTIKLFEVAKQKAEEQEARYTKLLTDLKQHISLLEDENVYYKKYAKELTKTLEGITNSKFWKIKAPISRVLAKMGAAPKE